LILDDFLDKYCINPSLKLFDFVLFLQLIPELLDFQLDFLLKIFSEFEINLPHKSSSMRCLLYIKQFEIDSQQIQSIKLTEK